MKKKTVNLKKLSLDKMHLTALNGAEQVTGGATVVLNTASPCNVCHITQAGCPPLTQTPQCVATGGMKTVCDLC